MVFTKTYLMGPKRQLLYSSDINIVIPSVGASLKFKG